MFSPDVPDGVVLLPAVIIDEDFTVSDADALLATAFFVAWFAGVFYGLGRCRQSSATRIFNYHIGVFFWRWNIVHDWLLRTSPEGNKK